MYRKEIDGLRAIAVIPVILFHAELNVLKGGFLGVDIFFVISGYLITSIILKEKEAGTFSLLNFYGRRARRILPALFFVVLCCLPAAWFLMVPHELKDFSQSLISVATYTSNIFFFLESGYFEAAAETKPLLHTWSLAVEEQFYIVFPIIFLICWRFGKRSLLFIVSMLLGLMSLLFAQWASAHEPSANFYLAPMRAWELLSGSLCAVFLAGTKSAYYQKGNGLIASIGVVMVCISIVIFDKTTPHPSFYTLIPVVGTVLIILFSRGDNFVNKILSTKLLVGVGLISYSAYLWHVPLLAFLRIYTLNNINLYQISFLVFLTFLLSFFSWKYIEAPFRNKDIVHGAYFYTGIIGLTVGLILIGYYGHITNGFHELKVAQLPANMHALIIDREKEVKRREQYWLDLLKGSDEPFGLGHDKIKVLFLGDSKSEDLYVAVNANHNLFPKYEFRRVRVLEECYGSLLKFSTNSLHDLDGESFECKRSINKLSQNHVLMDADIIVMTNTWWNRKAGYLIDVSNLAGHLVAEGKRINVVSTGNFNDLSSLSMILAKKEIDSHEAKTFFYENRRLDNKAISDKLSRLLLDMPNTHFLDKHEIFCNDSEKQCDLYSEHGRPYIYDTGHVTLEGAAILGKRAHELGWFSDK